MTRSSDVLVLGGGIVGAACAFHLTRAGIRVTVMESGRLIAGASRACDGLLLLWDKIEDADFLLGQESIRLWRGLADDLGPEAEEALELRREGCLALAPDAVQRETMGTIRDKMVRWGLASEFRWLEPDEIPRLEPGLSPGMAGALHFPNDLTLDARRATMTLLRLAGRSGARIEDGLGELRLVPDGDSVKVRGRFREYRADAVVVAAGAWTPLVLERIGIRVAIRPRKGHVLVVEKGPPLFRVPIMNVGYASTVANRDEDMQLGLVLEPTPHGTVLVGATREYVGYDTGINPLAIGRLARQMVRYLPRLSERRIIRTYAGLRPASDDRRPFIGRHGAFRGLYVASGHEGSGITLAMGTGRMIADMISGRGTFMDPTPFDPARGQSGR